MKWTFKRIIGQIFLTHIGRIILAFALVFLGVGIENDIITIISGGVVALEILFLITHAFIINPLRELIRLKKEKKK